MCPPSSNPHQKEEASTSTLKSLVGVLSLTSIGLLVGVIVLATQQSGGDAPASGAVVPEVTEASSLSQEERSLTAFMESKMTSAFFADAEDNTCAGKKIALDNDLCVNMEVAPQAGANVTKGYVGGLEVGDLKPNTKPYYQSAMCPVNVHWHLGSEHYSVGEYDEGGDGPHGNQAYPDWAQRARDLAEGKVRDGFRCRHYDAADEKFTKPYDWKVRQGIRNHRLSFGT